jgi:hypothetical protein
MLWSSGGLGVLTDALQTLVHDDSWLATLFLGLPPGTNDSQRSREFA